VILIYQDLFKSTGTSQYIFRICRQPKHEEFPNLLLIRIVENIIIVCFHFIIFPVCVGAV
jgi:hypothetical protein